MNSTKSREVIWGGRIRAAKMNAEHARQRAIEAAREADRAEAHAWSLRMEGYGGPAQPSPTIGTMSRRRLHIERNAGLGLTPVADPAPARYADLETGVKKRSRSGNPELGLSQFGILADIHVGGRARRACKA